MLSGVACTASTFCAAVGSYGTFPTSSQSPPTGSTLAETWDGSSWTVSSSPNSSEPYNELFSVSCASASSCMAVGSGSDYASSPPTGSALLLAWDGTSWSSTSVASPGSYASLASVSCPTTSFCMAVGSSSATGPLEEVWNGSAWATGTAPTGNGVNLNGVSCVTSSSCLAVGGFTMGGSPTSPGTTQTFVAQWDGASWVQIPSPDGAASGTGTINYLNAVACGSAVQCFAVGFSSPPCGSTGATSGGGSLTVSITQPMVSPSSPSLYNPVSPSRICDTRPAGVSGLTDQCTGKTLGPAATLEVQVTGLAQVPSGATGAVLNVTVTGPTSNGYLTIWPAGATQPLASNLNFVAGETIPNLVQVQLSASGAVDIYNSAGSTNVVIDVEGYFTPASGTGAGGDTYTPISPVRVADTRCDVASPPSYCAGEQLPSANSSLMTFGPGTTQAVTVAGVDGIPASGVGAVVLNVTVTGTTAGSFLTAWPAGEQKPTASNLNWVAGETIPNRVVVPVGTSNQVDIANYAGSAQVIVDVGGYYSSSSSGDQYVATSPVRLLDTRQGGQALGPGQSLTLQVAGTDGIPTSGVDGVVFNVTVTGGSEGSFLTVYPSGSPEPAVSDLNWVAGETIPNLVVVSLSSSGAVTITNNAGSVNVIVDAEGWYQSPSASAAARPEAVGGSSGVASSSTTYPGSAAGSAYTSMGPSSPRVVATEGSVTPAPHC